MARLSIFSTRKPRQYTYHPRHFDPDEEDLKARVASARGDTTDSSPEAVKARIRAGFNGSKYSMNRKFQRDMYRKSNKRVFVIALIITALIAYFVFTNLDLILGWMG